MPVFNGRNWSLADFLPFKFIENWDAFWSDVIAEMTARVQGVGNALKATSSTSSVAIGVGSKTLTIETGKGFSANLWVVASDAANPANSMTGSVTSYNAGTGALVLSVPSGGITGSGTPAGWTVGISGKTGATGPVNSYWGGAAGGTANALTAATGAGLAAITPGMIVGFKSGGATNSAAATLAVDGCVAAPIRKNGAALVGGELPINTDILLQYDGTYWRLASGGGMSDPTTTTGDMLYRSSAGALTRLPIGGNGTQLLSQSGIPVWVAPTSRDPYFGNVPFLIQPPTGASAVTDQSSFGRALTATAITLDAADTPFSGIQSMVFNGSSSYILFPDSADWDFPGDFCVEGWVKTSVRSAAPAGGGRRLFCAGYTAQTNEYEASISNSTGALSFGDEVSGGSNSSPSAIDTGAWLHWAVVRRANTMGIAFGGVWGSTRTVGGTLGAGSVGFAIGAIASTVVGTIDGTFSGKLACIRATNGASRYIPGTAFTSPATAFPTA